MQIFVDPNLSFADCIRDVARQVIAWLPAGTVGIGEGCLWQHCAGYISRHPKAPRGTSGAYCARLVFRSIMRDKPFSKFVYDNQGEV